MGKSQREKGRAGEREFQNIMLEQLGSIYGDQLDRNWNQRDTQQHDITLGPFALEIKRLAPQSYFFNQHWEQAEDNARRTHALMPLLAVRLDRADWKISMAMADMALIMELADQRTIESIPLNRIRELRDQEWQRLPGMTVTLPLDAFVYFSREYVAGFMKATLIPEHR